MSILSFLNQDQLDGLDEDPRIAFMELVNLAQRSLHNQTKDLDEDDRNQWREVEDLRLSFINVVIAAAKQYEIEPFYSMEVPRRDSFQMQSYHQFKFDLDHFITQLVINNSLRSREDTVDILPKSRDSIRSYLHNLRDCIENASMKADKREALLKRLDALESELEKRRVSMMTIARIAYHIWAIPGSAWASYEVANKLLNNVMQTVAEAKELEDQQRKLPHREPMKALSPPRVEQQPEKSGFANDLDDDIPF